MDHQPETIRLKSGTLGDLNGKRVGCDAIGPDTYTLPNGEEKQGTTAMLSMGVTDWITVGVGSQFEAGGSTWEVTAIKGDYVHVVEVHSKTDEEE